MSEWFFAWLVRFARRTGISTLLTVSLLALAMGIFWVGIDSMVGEARNLPGLLVAFCGMALGWALARSRVKAAWAVLLGGVAGLGLSLFTAGGLTFPLGEALGRLFTSTPGQPGGGLPDSLLVLWQGLQQTGQDSSVLLSRLAAWLLALLRSDALIDPVATRLFWGLAVWGVCFWAGFILRRTFRPLPALLPAGAILAGLTAYTQESIIYPLLLVCIYLALEVLLAYFGRLAVWAEEQVDAPELNFDVAMAAIGVPFFLAALAVATPSLSVQSVAAWWQSRAAPIEEESAARSLGIERGAGDVSAFQSAAATGLAREHLIGSGPELSEQTVLRVSLGGLQDAADSSSSGEELPNLYWRMLTYDTYTGSAWVTSDFFEIEIPPGEPWETQAVDRQGGWLIRQTVSKASGNNLALYTAGELRAASEPLRAAIRTSQDLFAAQTESRRYTADSMIPSASVSELQAAGSDYPDWVRSRYLQLPDVISTRVIDLALELTAREPTPYDRAAAITRYLRTYPYTLDVPKPPPGSEISDYFLFELQRGYCDYYATSMVVLARAAGLPARLVIGYASGSWDETSKQYVVTEAEAHSWVEVHFPGIGWVEFEPTAGRPEILHQGAPQLAEQEIVGELPPLVTEWTPSQGWVSMVRILVGGLLGLGIVLAGWVGAMWLRLQRMPPQALLEWQYSRLKVYAKRLGLGLPPGLTPLEFGALFSRELRSARGWQGGMPEEGSKFLELNWFADVYSRSAYSRTPASPEEKTIALLSWRRLAPRLWWMGVIRRLRVRLARI